MISVVENEKNRTFAFEPEKGKITAIVGLSKNAGKTSFLNWLIKQSKPCTYGILTTGRDGEEKDTVSGNKKPKVFIPKSSYFTTFDYVIKRHAADLTVCKKLLMKVTGKNIWLVKSNKDIFSEIIGPTTVSLQKELCEQMFTLGIDHIFVDGSLDRKSILLSDNVEQFFLIASAEYGNIKQILSELKKVILLSSIPVLEDIEIAANIVYKTEEKIEDTKFNTLLGNEEKFISTISAEKNIQWIYFPGVITSRIFSHLFLYLKHNPTKIYIKNPLQLQIQYQQLKKLLEVCSIRTYTNLKIVGIGVNSFSVSGNHIDCRMLRDEIRAIFKYIPIFDITEF